MRLPVEHAVVDDLGCPQDGIRVDQHGAEHRLFGILRVRRPAGTVRVAIGWIAVFAVRPRCHRGCDARTGHLPRSDVSRPGSGAARLDGK